MELFHMTGMQYKNGKVEDVTHLLYPKDKYPKDEWSAECIDNMYYPHDIKLFSL